MASWGNTVWSQQDTAGGTATLNLPVTYRRSAFGHQPVRLSNVTDGTSSTIFTGEQRQGQANDARGAVWTLAGIFMTRFTPNGTRDFYGVADPPGGGGDRLGDAFCVSEPGNGLPCLNSRHSLTTTMIRGHAVAILEGSMRVSATARFVSSRTRLMQACGSH